VWRLDVPEHWAAVGGTGSGRTTLARLVATTAAARLSPQDLHLYAVQAGGPLRDLADLPHTGAVAAHDDLPRVARLVRRLAHEVGRRQRVMAEHGWGSLTEWRAAADGPTPPALLLLVVDGWESLTATAEAVDHGELVDQLLGLLRDGAAAGLRALVTGGRELLRGRVSTLTARRLVLRLDDPADALLAGLPSRPRVGTGARPAGRCVVAPSGTEVQLALPDIAPDGGAPAPDLLTVPALPATVAASSLPGGGAHDDTVWLGVGGDAVVPVGLDPVTDGRLWLVAGPPRSGRSTALRIVADGLLASGRDIAVVGAGPGPLAALGADPRVHWIGPDDPDLLVAARRSNPRLAVLVDDADTLLDSAVEPVLREVARLAERDGGLLVCATATSSLAAQYRGLAVEVARRRTGLLLGPLGAADGDLLGVRLPRHRGAGTGRGLLVRRGEVTEIQVARPPQPSGVAPAPAA
jgi:S-DNA-T family DNA segregation ATPase FtsK/SpoIIIE